MESIYQNKIPIKISGQGLIFREKYVQIIYDVFDQMQNVIRIDPETIPEKISWMHKIHSRFYISNNLPRHIPIYCMILAEQECYKSHLPFPIRSLLKRFDINASIFLRIKRHLIKENIISAIPKDRLKNLVDMLCSRFSLSVLITQKAQRYAQFLSKHTSRMDRLVAGLAVKIIADKSNIKTLKMWRYGDILHVSASSLHHWYNKLTQSQKQIKGTYIQREKAKNS